MSRPTYVYVVSTMRNGVASAPCKCGITSTPGSRLATLQTGNPNEIGMSIFFGPMAKADAAAVEREVHRTYERFRMQGEWFAVDPRIVMDHVGVVISVFLGSSDDPVQHAKLATSLGFYVPRMMRPICNPDGSEYVGCH